MYGVLKSYKHTHNEYPKSVLKLFPLLSFRNSDKICKNGRGVLT